MSGNKCAYYNCGLSQREVPTIRKFSFPVRDPLRCRQWILNSGNIGLESLSPESLKKQFICDKHFIDEYTASLRLPPTAIPLKYSDNTETDLNQINTCDSRDSPKFTSTVTKVYPPKNKEFSFPSTSRSPPSEENDLTADNSWVTQLVDLSSIDEFEDAKKNKSLEKEIKSLKEKLQNSRRKIHNLKTQLTVAKKKIKNLQVSRKLQADTTLLPDFSRALVQMQLKSKKRRMWTSDEKKTALSIFYKGPSTYIFLRRKNVVLPSVSTLRKWVSNFICSPGFNKKIFYNLKLKSETMLSFEKKCILLFDEMAIKKTLEYNRKLDIIEGFEDLGEFGRKPVPATQALVLMVRGIYSQWKLPIAYFVSENGVKESSLYSIVMEGLRRLKTSGFDPIGLTCDLSQTNQKFFRHLGVNGDCPYFYMDNMKYFAFFDVPHLLKCVRNNFIDNVFKLENKLIKFDDIKKIYDLDMESTTGRSLPKLTSTHLNPNGFQKMCVKLAAQLFSHSVAAAIKTAVVTGQLTSDSALNTANFVECMDNLFDALNSTRKVSAKPYNKVLSDKNPLVLAAINRGYEVLKNIKKINKKGKQTRPDSFDGFLLTINAVKQFAAEQKEKGFPYLFTGRLIQDPLENQFSVYRQKGGYNRNPTVRSFKAAFKINIIQNLMRPPKGANASSHPDDDTVLSSEKILTSLNIPQSPHSSTSSCSDDSSLSIHSESSVLLQDCAIVYFAGYLVKKCIDRFKCKKCKSQLTSSEDLIESDEVLIFFKNYELGSTGGLKYPSQIMKKLTELGMKYFEKYIEKYSADEILSRIKKILIKKLQCSQPEWFSYEADCEQHRLYIIDLLIRTQIFKHCKFVSDTLKTPNKSKNVKLSIVRNA